MKENRWSTTQFDRPPMTKPRTPEEIAEEWFKIHDGMCVRSIDGQPYREHFLAALREATDEADIRLLLDEVERLKGGWEAAASKEIERSDALSRAEKAEAEASEHESRANRWMVRAQHAEAELAAAIKQALEQHRIVQDLGRELRAERAQRERIEKALRLARTKMADYAQMMWADDIAQMDEALRPAAPQESAPTPRECGCPVPDCQHHRGLIP